MVKVEYFIYLFKLVDILKNIHITSCALRKRNVKNNQFYLPSIIEFEVKGNSLGWIPIKVDEDESNLYNIVQRHSQNLSKKDRKRSYLFDNVNFVSGVLSCGNTSATIEPNVIYDADDDYENVETTAIPENITDENGEEITIGTTVKQPNVSQITHSTSDNKTTVQTTMPTKFYIDECSTGKLTCPTKTSEVKMVTDECPEITEEYCTFPLIITPPNPLPPLNLDFLTCEHNHSSQTHEKTAMPTKSMEYGGKCPPKHYRGESLTTTENVNRNKTTNVHTSKKPKHNKRTTEMAITSLFSVYPGNYTEQTKTSYAHQEQVGTTLSVLEILFPPLRKIHSHEKTTKSSSGRPTHETTMSKFEQSITAAKTKQTIKILTTSMKVQKTTTPSVQTTHKTTKHTSTSKISKSRHRGLSLSLKRDQINDAIIKDLSQYSSPWLSKVHPEDNNADKEVIKHRAISKLLEETQHFLKQPKPQVIIRIPSILGDLPVVIVKDPKIPALSLSVIPSEDNNQVILPLEYPFSLPQPNKLPYTANFSMLQYRHDNPMNVHLQYEGLNGLNISPDINSELNFNPYSIWPFMASSSVEPASSKYSLFSKYNFLYPHDRKLRDNCRYVRNHRIKNRTNKKSFRNHINKRRKRY